MDGEEGAGKAKDSDPGVPKARACSVARSSPEALREDERLAKESKETDDGEEGATDEA